MEYGIDDSETWGPEKVRAVAINMIKPLEGIAFSAQGAVIAEIFAIWLAGVHPSKRELILEAWINLMMSMTSSHAKQTDPVFAEDERKRSAEKPN